MKKTTNLTGKAAVFVRGFMEAFEENTSLRLCQEAGKAATEELGDEISIAYVSRLARDLSTDRIVGKVKKGRSYFLTKSVHTDAFLEWLKIHDDWGRDLENAGVSEAIARSRIVEHLDTYGGVRIVSKRPIDKAQFKLLMKNFQAGELELAFVEPGKGRIRLEGKTYKIRELGADDDD